MTLVLREDKPMTRNVMGAREPHPEFCGASCDVEGCENYGYANESDFFQAEQADETMLCWECAP